MKNLHGSKDKIRWGIVGAGRIAGGFASDIKHTQSATVVAVASRQLGSARQFADRFGIQVAYGSYAELFADPNIDAVYIATPHSHHKEQAIAALRAGKHVLCEKPATVTPAELEQVLAVAAKEQRYFMEGLWTYFLPAIHKSREWINAGRIGNLMHVKADFGFHFSYDPEIREYNKRLAGGCLLEMGIYPIAMAWLFLHSDPDTQSVWHHAAGNGVEDDVVILNGYAKNSITAQLTTSYRCKLTNSLNLIGDEGIISITDFWAAREAKLSKGDECVDIYREKRTAHGYHHQIDCVSCELLAGKVQPECVSWEDSRAFQRQMAQIKLRF